ncbi:DUF6132 family protein [Saccharicrinis aurantiacus]|uniref:DUF6132 family protein n=1 Tax=Saccharicrinis aurantiacus TaxID=1849719 RepID=UPI00094F92BF|nr:DUF6132 family protein [Saccharicrinis aurantiacus]
MKIWDKIKQQNWYKITFAILIGAGLGYAYYYFIGCSSGSCAITSNPWNSIGYGAFAGLILSIK